MNSIRWTRSEAIGYSSFWRCDMNRWTFCAAVGAFLAAPWRALVVKEPLRHASHGERKGEFRLRDIALHEGKQGFTLVATDEGGHEQLLHFHAPEIYVWRAAGHRKHLVNGKWHRFPASKCWAVASSRVRCCNALANSCPHAQTEIKQCAGVGIRLIYPGELVADVLVRLNPVFRVRQPNGCDGCMYPGVES